MAEPKRIGKYEILEEIGRGGFAAVYKAHDSESDGIVALKVLHPYWTADPGFVTRFRREARAIAKLQHRHIVTVYDAGDADDQLYIAMEYLPGRTLQALLEAVMEGDVSELQERLDELAQADGEYKPFVVNLQQLARGFKLNEIQNLLERHLEADLEQSI